MYVKYSVDYLISLICYFLNHNMFIYSKLYFSTFFYVQKREVSNVFLYIWTINYSSSIVQPNGVTDLGRWANLQDDLNHGNFERTGEVHA